MILFRQTLINKGSIFSLIILGLLFFLPTDAFAQEVTTSDEVISNSVTEHPYRSEILDDGGRVQRDFVVGPGKVEMSLEPGESKTVELLLTNRTGTEQEFTISFEDMTGSRTEDQVVVLLGNDRGPYTLRDYISVPQETFSLKYMERVRVPVTISIPADAEPSARYGSVLFSITSNNDTNGLNQNTQSASALVSRIGTLFFITTEGDIERSGEVVDFDTKNKQHWFWQPPIPFQVVFENTGSQHLNPYGFIKITNIFGKEVGYVEIDPWYVLPQALRVRDLTFPQSFLFGYYKAELQLNRGYDNVVDTREVSFFVLPLPLLATLFAGLTILFLLLKLIFSRFEIKRK